MRVALFDDVGGGHRPAFMAGLARAMADDGHRVTGFGSAEDDTPAPPCVASWHRVPLVSVTDILRGRAMLAAATRLGVEEEIEVWCDLDLNRNILRADRRLLAIPHRIHIVHRVDRPFHRYRTTLGRVRAAYSRRRMRWLAEHGSAFAVHTPRALDFLSRFLPASSLVLLPLPVKPVEPVATSGLGGHPRPPRALFVGRVRPDRGFKTLVRAIQQVPGLALDVVGRQDAGLEEWVTREHPAASIGWQNRYVAEDELHDAYRRAGLVVLPYDAANSDSGSASMVLLEALAHGAPLVVSPAVEGLLPTDFRGAIAARGHDPEALAEALRRALERLPELTACAAEEGPRLVHEKHSFQAYAEGLLEGALGGRDTP